MRLFFRFVLCYLVLSFLVTAFVRQQGVELLAEAAVATLAFGTAAARIALLMVPLLLAVPFIMGWGRFVSNLNLLSYALLASALLQTAFSFLKSTIPMVVPFYADPAFAEADRWLHGGTDPWVIAHSLGLHLPMEMLLPVYLSVWAVPAIGLAVILAVADHDAGRKARFMVLYLFCWLFLGNVLAAAGSSVGPVFYDALLGGDRFAGLHAALAESGVAESRIGAIQFHLWRAYAEGGMAIGSGISAFPSVHVGIATLTAIYLAERSRWLILPGLAFLLIILFLSVYTGYHYALDGYVSIAVMIAAWAALRRVDLTTLALRWERRDLAPVPAIKN